MSSKPVSGAVRRGNENQWIESRGGRDVTVTDHPVRPERVEFLNEPADPESGPLTLKFYLGSGHEVGEHTHPEQTETITVQSGRVRATIDGDARVLERGDHVRIEPGVSHGYEVVSDEEAVLAVSMTPALSFKEFVLAEHALSADSYPESGLSLPYFGLVTKAYGPMIAAPVSRPVAAAMGVFLPTVARVRGLRIPDDPLPVRESDSESDT
ncbi:cupin domain-containing protein [Natronorubrum sp. DTA28]|uniref:cupin domain-containing protein n=1 Tax=Natronorubrum sp. DTA28 TaxID=3447019 RepID=UPI003F843350